MILRMVWKKVEPAGTRTVTAGLVGDTFTIEEYGIVDAMLILQDPSMVEVTGRRPPARFTVKPKPWKQYCRWHNGPLDRPDKVLERIYCNMEADGYCRYHKRSERAIYEACLTLRGERGLSACRLLDRTIRTEYAVYMTDFGGHKPKVGVTRRFRLLERIAEQSHITATILIVTDSAYRARLAETRISSSGLAQEVHRRVVPGRRGLPESAARLSYWAERAARLIGEEWEGRILRIVPPWRPGSRPSIRRAESLAGEEIIFESYWGGLILAGTREGPVLLPARELQHHDSVELGEGGEGPQ